jgi:hypothetical protein
MKSLRKIILFVLIGTLFVTCKKETLAPASIENQPVFSFSGNVGGNALNLQAGVNSYYMYSSDSQSAAGVYNFIGTLKNISTNKNSIQIIISDYRVSVKNAAVTLSHIDTSLSITRTYSCRTVAGTPTGYSVKYTPIIYAGTPMSYNYNFGDGNTSNAVSPTYVYTTIGKYPTWLTIKFTNGDTVTMRDTIRILKTQPQLWIDSIQSSVVDTMNGKALVAFTATVNGGASPYTYMWSFGDGSTTTAKSASIDTISHQYNMPNHIYPVYLRVANSAGDTESYNYKVWSGEYKYPSDLMTYNVSSPQLIKGTDSVPPNVVIKYTDANGNVYTSNNVLQSSNSSFQVLSVSSYQNNTSNEPTEMLKVSFSCTLYNGANSIPASGTAIIAVAYQ